MFRQSEPLEILGASPDDAPVCYLRINSDWAVLLIGLAEYLLSPWFWDENTGDVDAAITDAARLIQILGDCMTDNVAIFAEQRASGVPGGSSVTNGYQYRDINTVIVPQSWASINGGQLHLDAGKYHVHARAQSCGSATTRLTLHNSQSPIVYHRGDSAYAPAEPVYPSVIWAVIDAVLDLPVDNNILVLQYTQTAFATYGLGVAVSDPEAEQYATVVVTRLPG